MRSPKRTSDGDDKSLSNFKLGRLLTLDDIEKEYMLINMSLRLAKNNCTQITSGMLSCLPLLQLGLLLVSHHGPLMF